MNDPTGSAFRDRYLSASATDRGDAAADSGAADSGAADSGAADSGAADSADAARDASSERTPPPDGARSVVLVGLMGAGKSTVGRILALVLGRRMIDSDTAIEETTGSTVRQLWESGGEAAYRAMESQVVLDSIDADPPVVIAAPGGVVLDPQVRAALTRAFVVWLRADPASLATRVRIGDHRPLLGDDPAGVLTRMSSERAELYGSVASIIIDTDDLTPDQITDRIIRLLSRFIPGTTGSDQRSADGPS